MDKLHKCEKCGQPTETADHSYSMEVGETRVVDATEKVEKCVPCRYVSFWPGPQLERYETRACAAVLSRGGAAVTPAVLKAARHTLGLLPLELGSKLDIYLPEGGNRAVTDWEDGTLKPPRTVELAILALLYEQELFGHAPTGSMPYCFRGPEYALEVAHRR